MTPQTYAVVIPTYERVEETVRAAESACAQTLPPASVVVVDDGSSADVRDQLRERLAALGVRFVEGGRNSHPGRARNRGVREVDTDWIAFLDSDDVWHPHKMQVQMDLLAQTGAVMCCSNADRVVDGLTMGTVHAHLPSTVTFGDLLRGNLVINSTVVIRGDVLASVGGVAESFVVRGTEDYATWLRVASSADIAVVQEPLIGYTDMPETSIRGTEASSHPGQHAAWLDYLAWRRDTGRPLPLSERVVHGVLRRALARETRRRPGRR